MTDKKRSAPYYCSPMKNAHGKDGHPLTIDVLISKGFFGSPLSMILADSDDTWRPSKPSIVLLQGPVGPFFRQLASKLDERGFDGIARELERARMIWRRCHPVSEAVA